MLTLAQIQCAVTMISRADIKGSESIAVSQTLNALAAMAAELQKEASDNDDKGAD